MKYLGNSEKILCDVFPQFPRWWAYSKIVLSVLQHWFVEEGPEVTVSTCGQIDF